MTWKKVLGYELGWQLNAEKRPGAIALRIEGSISEEIADIGPLRSEDYYGILEILLSGKTTWYEPDCKFLITREQMPCELSEDNPARSIDGVYFRGYSWAADRYPPGVPMS